MNNRDIPVEKNQYVEMDFTGLGHNGEGVGKYLGYTLFVPGVLPNERAKVKVIKVNKNYGYGRLEEVLEKSPERKEPECPIFKQCGGCQLQHITYKEQLKQKRILVEDNLKRIGKLDEVKVFVTLGMDNPYHYRNKAQIPLAEREGGLIAGFYAKGTHEIIDMKECIIQQEENNETVRHVKEIAEKLGISIYDEKINKGFLRHIISRNGANTSELMLILVTNGSHFKHKDAFIEEIVQRIPKLTSVIQNINTMKTNVILGRESITLWGRDVIYDTIGDIKFAISPRSFFQVNPEQTKVLYQTALDYADLSGTENVIDAYCGIGTISLFLAQKAKHVYGVEIVADAIKDAKRNAELNEIDNVTFKVGAAEKILPEWQGEGITADVVVVDPPRKGLETKLIDTILQLRPKKIVYVSCNPSTLARDLRLFEDGGYQTKKVQPVDMFPQTMHVECVTLMSRVEK